MTWLAFTLIAALAETARGAFRKTRAGELDSTFVAWSMIALAVPFLAVPTLLAGIPPIRDYAGKVVAIVCTSPNHYRDFEWAHDQFKSPVLASEWAPTRSQIRQNAAETYGEGASLPGGIHAKFSGDNRAETCLY